MRKVCSDAIMGKRRGCSGHRKVGDVRRLIVVLVLVAAFAGAYRHYASPTTGTGPPTLPPPAPGDDAPAFSADRAGRRGAFSPGGEPTWSLSGPT